MAPRTLVLTAALTVIWLVSTAPVHAQVEAGVRFGDEGLEAFYLAVGDHFSASQSQVQLVAAADLDSEEVPVVLFLAHRSGQAPRRIVELRRRGDSWLDIALDLGVGVEQLYVPVAVEPGPPYGKAYGHFKNKPRSKWNTIRLSDAEVVDLVNLRFVAEATGRRAEEVIELRSRGTGFVVLYKECTRDRPAGKDRGKDRGKGKGKDKDKDKDDSKGKNKGKGKG